MPVTLTREEIQAILRVITTTWVQPEYQKDIISATDKLKSLLNA